MGKFKFEKQYRGNLSIDGALEHFTDEIAGKLDCGLENDRVLELSTIDNYAREILFMENGMDLEIEVSFDNQTDEWVCTCEEMSNKKSKEVI